MNKIFNDLHTLYHYSPRELKKGIVIAIFLMFFSSIAETVGIASLLPFIKYVMNPEGYFDKNSQIYNWLLSFVGSNNLLLVITFLYCLIIIFACLIRLWSNKISTKLSFNIGHFIALSIFEIHLKKKYEASSKIKTADIISAVIYNTDGVVYQVIVPLMTGLSACLSLIMFSILIGWVSPYLLISALLLISLAYLLVSFKRKGIFEKNGESITLSLNRSLQIIQDALFSIKEILLNKNKNYFINRLKVLDKDRRDRQGENIVLSTSPRIIVETFFILSIAILLLLVKKNTNDISSLASLLAMMIVVVAKSLPLVNSIYLGIANIKSGRAALENILLYLNSDEVNLCVKNNYNIKMENRFLLNDISIKGTRLFNRLNLEIRKGDKIAIVGKSGVGKTTLVNIMMGLLLNFEGQLIIDDTVIENENVSSWQDNFTHIPQNIYLFNDTLVNNITFYQNNKIDDKKFLDQVIEECELSELIQQKKDTLLGENAREISGGERQRLAIARALYSKRDILIFDEATSALDQKSEERILSRLMGKKALTIIMITHRVSSLYLFDKVFELSEGSLKKIKG